MLLNNFINDKVTLIKADGQIFKDIPASVQSGLILTQNPSIPIEDGDKFERKLPSGVVERFIVFDTGYHNAFHGIPAHYQSKVKKESAVNSEKSRAQVVYNLIGPNTRVNIQSTDSSTNIVNVETNTLFSEIKKVISEAIADETIRSNLAKEVDAMQSAVGTRSFSDHYKNFIGLAADHIAVFTPFIPALSQLLI